MCYVLYIGTDHPLPTIPWKEDDRKLNTADLSDNDRAVAAHFTKPHQKYLGSYTGCGCGFRHLTFQNGSWPEEPMIGSEHYTGEDEQPIHQQLHDYISELLTDENSQIELYGCWDGDFVYPSAGSATIPLSLLLDKTFFFRERFGYIVTRSELADAANPHAFGIFITHPAGADSVTKASGDTRRGPLGTHQ